MNRPRLAAFGFERVFLRSDPAEMSASQPCAVPGDDRHAGFKLQPFTNRSFHFPAVIPDNVFYARAQPEGADVVDAAVPRR